MAQAKPAGPPPTMTTPTSIRSSSGSTGGPTNSEAESTGGGNSTGAVVITLCQLSALFGLHRLGQLGQNFVQIPDDAQIREFENGRIGIFVYCDDVLRALHPDLVLDGAGDARG